MLLKICHLFTFCVCLFVRKFPSRNLCYIWKHLEFMLMHSLSSRAIHCQKKNYEWNISHSSDIFQFRKRKDYLDGDISLRTLFLITRILSEACVLRETNFPV